jgi:NTP pyrophosphatase (non-canonical NTP hydrolase)
MTNLFINLLPIYRWLSFAGNIKGDLSKVELSKTLLEEEVKELFDGINNDNNTEIIDACCDIIWILMNVLFFRGIDLLDFKKYFNKVKESNYSKFCTSEFEAKTSQALYKTGDHPDKPGEVIHTIVEKVGTYYVIKRLDGKVLKSAYYKKLL